VVGDALDQEDQVDFHLAACLASPSKVKKAAQEWWPVQHGQPLHAPHEIELRSVNTVVTNASSCTPLHAPSEIELRSVNTAVTNASSWTPLHAPREIELRSVNTAMTNASSLSLCMHHARLNSGEPSPSVKYEGTTRVPTAGNFSSAFEWPTSGSNQ
jgi:hypothetical protein